MGKHIEDRLAVKKIRKEAKKEKLRFWMRWN